jgi:DNA-binding IclR family transcriptional regulator
MGDGGTELSARQEALLLWIAVEHALQGRPPTLRELARRLGYRGPGVSTVYRYMERLIASGLVCRDGSTHQSRVWRVTPVGRAHLQHGWPELWRP